MLASQRSGSTLLVESLRATGVAGEPQEFFQYLPTTSQSPQPREWFADVEDESILSLLDPLDAGKPDLAPPEIWRDYIRTVGRTPNGVWGGKLMWNQTPLLSGPRQRTAGSIRRRPAGRDPRRRRRGTASCLCLPAGRGVAGGVVLAGGTDAGVARQARSRSAMPVPRITRERIAHVVTMLRAQEQGWRAWFAEEDVKPMEIPYPVLWRNLTQVVGNILESLGLDPQLAPEPVLERQADQRSDDWVDRYRADAEREGLPL